MGLNLGGIIGGIVGAMIPGLGPLGASLGAGLGAKATGASNKEAMMYGLGGLMLGGGAGKMLGGLGAGAGAGVGGGAGGGLMGLLNSKGMGNALLLGSLASGAMGIANPTNQDPFALDRQMTENWNKIETPNGSMFVDPETGKRYETAAERDAAMEARGSTYNQPTAGGNESYTPTTMPATFANGGYIQGPGTGTSDSIPAMIYQNGGPVRKAALSDGEFVMTEAAVKGMGGGDRELGAARMYKAMNNLSKGYA